MGRWAAGVVRLKFQVSAFAQTTTGDLDISSGNLVVRSDVAQVTAWKLTNLFSLFKGEWFRDLRVGVPYIQYVFVKNPSLGVIGSLFRQVCQSAPGVARVTEMDLNYTPKTRKLAVNIQAQTNDGAQLQGGPGVPFIITQQPSGSP